MIVINDLSMRNKKVFVLYVNSILSLRKWLEIISNCGVKVGKQYAKIAKCYVRIVIQKSQINIRL